MKSLTRLGVLLSWVFLTAACTPAQEPVSVQAPDTTTADIEAIREIVAGLDAAWSARDAEAAMAYYADDAVEMPAQEPVRVGKVAIAERTANNAANYEDEITSTVDDVQISGDLAFARISYEESWTPVTGGDTTSVVGKSIFVFRRQDDGSWKVLQLIWNFDHPIAAQ